MWQGVLIEESLVNKDVLKIVKIIKTVVENLEKEDRIMTFHNIEVKDSDKELFLNKLLHNLKSGFYCHICKNGEMFVVFKNKLFNFKKGSLELKKAFEYGKSVGIIAEQMPFEHLIEHPFD